MNNVSAKIDFQIPDFWYDIYARFLPGIAFVGFLWWFYFTDIVQSEQIQLFIAKIGKDELITILILTNIFLGYLAGMMVNPISSIITDHLQSLIERILPGISDGYVDSIRYNKVVSDHDKQIIGKMRAEVVFFAQMAIFTLLLFFIDKENIGRLIGIFVAFFILTVLVTCRRICRAMKIGKYIISEQGISPALGPTANTTLTLTERRTTIHTVKKKGQ